MKKIDYQGFEQNTQKISYFFIYLFILIIKNFFISSAKKQHIWWGRWASLHEEKQK